MATASKQFELKGLRESRSKIRTELEGIGTAMRSEGRAMKVEEREKFTKLTKDLEVIGEQIRSGEAELAKIDELVSPANDTPAPIVKPGREDRSGDRVESRVNPQQRAEDIQVARRAWVRRQCGLKNRREEVEACKRVGFNLKSPYVDLRLGDPKTRGERLQQRALTVTTSAGGYLIAQDYSYQLEQKMVSFSNVRGICDEFSTDTGADLPYPTEDDTGNTGELLAINTEVAYADPTFASVTFLSFKFSSKGVVVPNELIQDSAFDVDSLVFGEIGTRLGRITGGYYTTGAGTTEPKGVVTCAAAGVTTASATAFTSDELLRLALSVDPAYQSNPGVGYMMKQDVLGYCMMLKDGLGRPLLRETMNAGISGHMIHGYPVYVNQKMTGLTSSLPVSATKHVIFGDYKKFKIRDVGSIRVYRANERLIEKDQALFVGFMRSDSNCVNTAAIKYLLQA